MNLISILGAEAKKMLLKKEFFIGLLGIIVMGCGMVYGVYEYPDSFGIHNVSAFYGNFASILILFLAARALGEDFDLRTSTFVFTSKCSRVEIYTAKLFSVIAICMVIGFCGGLLHSIAAVITGQQYTALTLLQYILELTGAYALYGFVAAAAALLLATHFRNTIMPLIIMIILYWVMPGILEMMSVKIAVIKNVIEYIGFTFADDFIMYQSYSWKAILVLLINGLFIYAINLMMLRKIDLS